jgi:choline dehydrogenase-like flavoprotein
VGVRNLLIGSGPAAAGVALALARVADEQITVVDVGVRLEQPNARALTAMASAERDHWTPAQVQAISLQPVAARAGGRIPQKRTYGSDFPFRDVGQLDGVSAQVGANTSVISGAYGGFSNVWGAQITPFTEAAFRDWPVSWQSMQQHYRAVLREVPLAAQQDDLEDYFPLLVDSPSDCALPPLNPRFERLLRRYDANREQIRTAGVTLGRARLALRSDRCVRCALCMTGCPYGLIYSASQTFDRLVGSGRVAYRGGILVTRIVESDSCNSVEATDLSTGKHISFEADRVFVAAGAMGSTRLALASMENPPDTVSFGESSQFAMPFASIRSIGDPRRTKDDFTLNQVNVVVAMDDEAWSLSQIHLYPYNRAMLGAMPGPLRLKAASPLAGAILGRLTVGLGYLPSWASPRVTVHVRDRGAKGRSQLEIAYTHQPRPPMLDAVLSRLSKVGGLLDLRPVGSITELSGSAKSYHYGGSFPHRSDGGFDDNSSDLHGRVRGWRRTHIVDASVFPTVPATTFMLTVMANAHRIASEVVGEGVE